MRQVCIYGAGAVGGFIGAHLARSGCQVSAVARGNTLSALRRHGLRVQTGDGLIAQRVVATDDPSALGVQDLVVVAVKAQSLAQIAPRIPPLVGPRTTILTAMNGVPWWFFDGFGGDYAGLRLESVDPDGAIAASIPTARV
ncbi:MAG TPA: 2-dehydropantoate 2-reductase N-terminal domain-containing protein, partial [Deferrisomatales bacterium]|nr:2-dehydropantoate 2-reductase N-terminal domain-containing protein [Deferrisomatales bacterium]